MAEPDPNPPPAKTVKDMTAAEFKAAEKARAWRQPTKEPKK
jgi:hypothetical protein